LSVAVRPPYRRRNHHLEKGVTVSDVLVCVGCGRSEGHSDMCDLGGYVPRGTRHELVTQIEHEHNWQFSKPCLTGCRYCAEEAGG
jgi:hypothetical protein